MVNPFPESSNVGNDHHNNKHQLLMSNNGFTILNKAAHFKTLTGGADMKQEFYCSDVQNYDAS